MSDYNYTLSADQTLVTVTTDLDAFDAQTNWPATSQVSRRVSLLLGRPVQCAQVGNGGPTVCTYSIEPDTHPVAVAETAYRVAQAAQLHVENDLNSRRDLDDETPSATIWSRSPEWRAASEATERAYDAYQAAIRGLSNA